MKQSEVKERQKIRGNFQYIDRHERTCIPNYAEHSEMYTKYIQKLGFEKVQCTKSRGNEFVWMMNLPNSGSSLSFYIIDSTFEETIDIWFELQTHSNRLTEQQAKWILSYLMEVFIYQNKPTKALFLRRLLENEPCHDNHLWDEY